MNFIQKIVKKRKEKQQESKQDEQNPECEFYLGECYAEGKMQNEVVRGCAMESIEVPSEPNWDAAFTWYRKAARNGHVGAKYKLGFCFANGLGVRKSPSIAIHWYIVAAQEKNVDAMYALGEAYEYGAGVQKIYEHAFDYYRDALKYGLRTLHKQKPSVEDVKEHEQEEPQKIKLVRSAIDRVMTKMANQWVAEAKELYMDAVQEPSLKCTKILNLLRDAHLYGSKEASYLLAKWSILGMPLVQKQEAERYLVFAASGGLVQAQYELAEYCYQQGKRKVGLHWRSIASNNGHLKSQYELALNHLNCTGGIEKTDNKEAMRLLESASEGGLADATYKLAMQYSTRSSNRERTIYLFDKLATLPGYQEDTMPFREIIFLCEGGYPHRGSETSFLYCQKILERCQDKVCDLAKRLDLGYAHYTLGDYYECGRIGPPDLELSRFHYQKALEYTKGLTKEERKVPVWRYDEEYVRIPSRFWKARDPSELEKAIQRVNNRLPSEQVRREVLEIRQRWYDEEKDEFRPKLEKEYPQLTVRRYAEYDFDSQAQFLDALYAYKHGYRENCRAFELMQLSADQHDPDGQYYLAEFLYHGIQKNDYKQALQYYTMAANQGHKKAQETLEGLKKPVDSMHVDATQGDVESQLTLGSWYEFGYPIKNVDQDLSKAFQYYKMAADQEESYGHRKCGLFYRLGNGVPKDFSKAVFHLTEYTKVSTHASPIFYMLGCIYETGGPNLPSDLKQADIWYRKASNCGHSEAQKSLQRLLSISVPSEDAKSNAFVNLASTRGVANDFLFPYLSTKEQVRLHNLSNSVHKHVYKNISQMSRIDPNKIDFDQYPNLRQVGFFMGHDEVLTRPLPDRITHLQLKTFSHQPIDMFPKYLTHLDFQCRHIYQLPNTLKCLKLMYYEDSKWELSNSSLEGIEDLHLEGNIHILSLPSSLQSLYVGYKVTLEQTLVPVDCTSPIFPNLTKLYLESCSASQFCALSAIPSLTDISVSRGTEEKRFADDRDTKGNLIVGFPYLPSLTEIVLNHPNIKIPDDVSQKVPKLTHLTLKQHSFQTFSAFPQTLTHFTINFEDRYIRLPKFPSSLVYLHVQSSQGSIPPLPPNLQEFISHNDRVPNLPASLKRLELFSIDYQTFYQLPFSLQHLCVSFVYGEIPFLPPRLLTFTTDRSPNRQVELNKSKQVADFLTLIVGNIE